ncbi:MAG TPA: chemotaxis protein CheR, partial [Spirochaetia bacterium]|nr:chemotaxis protein CheR [Spirochaetia bacterium]
VIYLQNNKDEAKLLFKDMLISVTNFFRDTQAFEVINDTIIKKICTNIAPHQSIRVWVPGCATGEEAYSIAILFQEKIEELKKNIHIQIFATDIDSQALMVARAGTYSANIALNVSKEQLERFFTLNHDTNTYTIKKSIRDMLIFSEQNYIKDPPFSKIDIISCRNSLIYMTGELQKKVFPMFHYALNPGGFLILGTSESIGDFTNLFDEYDRKFKIYHKKDSEKTETSPSISDFLDLMKKPDISVQMSDKKLTVKEIAEQSLIKQYATVFVVVNEKKEILYVSGRTGKYLESVQGDFNGNIIKMAREGLEQKLTTALHKVINKGIESVSCNKLRVKTNGDFTLVNLKIKKLNASLFMVVFEDTVPDSVAGADDNEKNDFTYDKDYYKAMQEEMTTSNEELKSSNEEMQSVNEELQSTNEELETSKEEMQSLNEELSTVNNEMQVKMAELFQINNDMNNLMAATGVATIYVDLEIHIRKFTPPATKIVNLIKTDIGRPLKHIVTNILKYNTMIKDIQTVIDTLISKEIEMELQNNTWFLMRILPYRTTSNMIDGAVITFFEITEIKKAHQILINNEMLQQLAIVVRDAYDAIIVQSMTGEIIEWNPSAQRMYGWSKEEAITMNISDIIPEDLKKTELKIIEKLAHSTILETYRSKRISKKGEVLEVWLTSTALVDENNKIYAITTTERLFKE